MPVHVYHALFILLYTLTGYHHSMADWQSVNNNRQAEINSLDKQQQMRDRGNVRTNEFNQNNRPATRPASRPMGGRRR